MQRIIIRYQRESSASALSHGDLRAVFLGALELAGLAVEDGRRPVLLGPPLPPGATSEAELAALELAAPHDPSAVWRAVNAHLPDGLNITCGWITPPGSSEENPATLDEAVYDVLWPGAPAEDVVRAAYERFLATGVVEITRVREKKTQVVNVRSLVRDLTFVARQNDQSDLLRFRMTVSVGPLGTVRAEEVVQALGFTPAGTLRVHRVALLRSAWRHPSPGSLRRRCPEF